MTELPEGRVRKLAALANLSLSDDEERQFGEQLDRILGFARHIQALDTDDVPPTSHALLVAGQTEGDALRSDVVTPSLDRDQVLDGAPDSGDGLFKVPRVLP